MAWSFQVAKAFGIPIRVHLTFLLIVAWSAFTWGSRHGARGALFGVASILLLFVSVALHELGHSVVAQRRGLTVREIVLLPIGGVAALDGKPSRPRDELWIALAGPAVNFVLALVLGLGAVGLASAGLLDVASVRAMVPTFSTLLALLIAGNVSLGLFNLLPIFPMDGGRVLRALLADHYGMEKGTRWAAGFGQVAAVGLGTFAILSGAFVMAFIAVMIFFAAGRERLEAAALGAAKGIVAADVSRAPSVLLEPGESIGSATRRSLRASDDVLPVVLGERLAGVVSLADLVVAMRTGREREPVAAIASQAWIDVDVTTPLETLLDELARKRALLAVVHDQGVPVGVVTGSQLRSALQISGLALRAPGPVTPPTGTARQPGVE
ncbi:MAG: site-2 protease family protein [Myxococcales bacterium]|nr:site-2 protease family protein [Myxococcales bacterium]